MKKTFSLLALLLLLCTSAWGTDHCTKTVSTDGKTCTWNFYDDYSSYTPEMIVAKDGSGFENGLYIIAGSKSNASLNSSKYLSIYGTNNDAYLYIPVPSNAVGTITFTYGGSATGRYTTLLDSKGKATSESVLPAGSGNTNTITLVNANVTTQTITGADGNTWAKLALTGGEIKYRIISITLTTGTYASNPIITTQPQSASYASGQTIAALTVAATASEGSLTYQWYSCDDANKTNATVINGATSASYTPTAAGFYYVKVSDSRGNIDSNVAIITVSAAEAPTINVSGAPENAIVSGTAVTLTAEVTGIPAPTIQWYSNTTASTSNGTPIEGETNETYSPSTASAGTYYFYAVAHNSQGDATSALQTIVVKDKVATPTFTPNGKHFDGTQRVTIACTTADATIQYSTNGGTTWTDYTAPFDVNATTTVMAKATKSGCFDSDEASATFTKITLIPQANVSASTTWDWADVTNSAMVEFSSGTELYNADVTYVNISKYEFTEVAGLAAQSALLMNGQRAYNNANGSKHCQVNYLKFNATVPGTVTVEYANTGGNAARTVKVNDQKGSKSSEANNSYQSETFAVAAGTVTIAGVQVSDDAAKMLRIRKVVFTRVTSVSKEISAAGWATYCSPYALDFSSSITNLEAAYIVTGATGDVVSLAEVTGTVPAGTGLLLKGNGTCTIPTAANGEFDVTDNKLVGKTAEYTLPAGQGYILLDGDDGIGFYINPTSAFSVGANTAYLPANFTETNAPSAFRLIDEENNATNIKSIEANEKAVKFIENGRILILRDGVTYDALGRVVR